MSEHITTSETETEARDRRVAETVEKAVKGLFDVGRLWAAHGLNVGRSALETSALTLRKSAEILGELSERFDDRDREGGAADGSAPSDRAA